jgi:hypothetical protein
VAGKHLLVFPWGRPDLPSLVYIIDAMHEIDLEPEVEAWLLDLPYGHYHRVMRNVDDYLVTGGMPDGDHVKKLQDADDVYELRSRSIGLHGGSAFGNREAGSSSCSPSSGRPARALRKPMSTEPSEVRSSARQDTT